MSDFRFRRLGREDFGLVAQWLALPHVLRWWAHEFTPEAVERDFGQAADGLEPSQDWLAHLDEVSVGLLQFCRWGDYPQYVEEIRPVYEVNPQAATIDYFVGPPDLIGKGVGTAMIAAFLDRLWTDHLDLYEVVVPVNASNPASWRALENVGFSKVATGDLEPDNPIDSPLHHVLRITRPS